MSAPGTTPGPWEVYRHPINGADDAKAELAFQVDNTDPIGDTLFLINAGGKCPALTGCGPTSEANAHLIAASPAMYDALEALLEGAERHIFGDECLSQRNAARAVLAQARGEKLS